MEKLNEIPGVVVEFAPRLLLALAILFIGKFVLGRVMQVVNRWVLNIPNVDKTLAGFFGSTIYFAVMALIIVAALSALSISMGFLATVVSALVLAIGFALQGALGDLASGIVLIILRPYNVGDEVELNGCEGVVTNLALFATRMRTRENVEIIIGNGAVLSNNIKNNYAYKNRRLDMEFGVDYGADLNETIVALLSVCKGDGRILVDPAPWAKVVSLGDSSVNLELRVWCKADDHRLIEMDLPYRVKKALDGAGIEIPYPHTSIVRKEA